MTWTRVLLMPDGRYSVEKIDRLSTRESENYTTPISRVTYHRIALDSLSRVAVFAHEGMTALRDPHLRRKVNE